MTTSGFCPKTATWQIAWPGRVARHDLVYLTPPCDPMQGLPLGNGDIGVLCWCEDTKLVFAVNKCDHWGDASFGRFNNWKPEEEEYSTTLRHACRLYIDFLAPVFDVFYLSDFRGRLSLADASITITASTPFGDVSARVFLDHDTGVMCCEVTSALEESIPVHVTLERYGSRTFSHWYSLVNRDAAIGLKGTETVVDDNGAFITHKLTSGTFAAGCCVTGKGAADTTFSRVHSRSARAVVTGNRTKTLHVLLAVTSPLAESPVRHAEEMLASAREKGMPALYTAHAEAWKTFWQRSLMASGDDYLDNLWHLTMYYAYASQRGAYPGRFIGGLWGWNRDVQPWNFYFHWNQQQIYWPLNAAGHHELMDSYLAYRFRALPHGQLDAREVLDADGTIVSDVCERRGYNSTTLANHTPVAQIAMEFWRQYQFTGDREFLRTRALPYIVEAAKFFESLFERAQDGNFHAKGGLGYEGRTVLRDVVSEMASGRVLFETALAALAEVGANEPRARAWRSILDDFAPLLITKAGTEMIANEDGKWVLKRGLFRGADTFSDDIFAAGFGIEEQCVLTSFLPHNEPAKKTGVPAKFVLALEQNRPPEGEIPQRWRGREGIFPWVEFAPVFPSGLIGLGQRGTKAFRMAVNTARAYGYAGMGWNPLPIVLARLGLSDELERTLALWPGHWQFYCNGFGHYGPRDTMKADGALRFRTTRVRDANLPSAARETNLFPFPAWPFRHMGMESMSVLACAMNEALLQSHDGVIRIAPAAGKRDARFTLHAAGGFIVSAELARGEVRWVCILSRLGSGCRFENPWARAWLFTNDAPPLCAEGEILELRTKKGEVTMIVPSREAMEEWKTSPIACEANQASKTHSSGEASLGLPRLF